jgi:glycosyltransferase involved in cell wall biosynthesis
MGPYEAFLSEKPVVTTTDSGGPLEIVTDMRTGLVCAPRSADLGRACSWLLAHRDDARSFGRAGRELAAQVTWEQAIERLLAAAA